MTATQALEQARHLGLITKAELRFGRLLAWYQRTLPYTRLKLETIAAKIGASVSTVQRAIRKFVQLGWLRVERKQRSQVFHLEMTGLPTQNDRSQYIGELREEEVNAPAACASGGEEDYEREPFFEDGGYTREQQRAYEKAARPRKAPPSEHELGRSESGAPARRPPATDPVLDALADVEYSGRQGVSARGKVSAAAKRLWRDEYERVTGQRLSRVRTPPGSFKKEHKDRLAGEVETKAATYREKWPDRTLTSTALVSAWDTMWSVHEDDEYWTRDDGYTAEGE